MHHQDFSSSRLDIKLVQKTLAHLVWPVLHDTSLYTYIPEDSLSLEKLENRYAFWEQRISPDKTEYWLNWVVFTKEDQRAIGELQAGVHIESKVASIAYKVGSSFQGKGYATEGVIAMIEHLKRNYGVIQIKAWIDTRNQPSIKLVERIGMTQVEFIEKADHFKGSDSDEYVYQLDLVTK
jgi:RimJ/RimL family protein N-acetyltransferase